MQTDDDDDDDIFEDDDEGEVFEMDDLSNLTYNDIDYESSEMAPPFLDPNSCLMPDAEPVVRVERAPDNSRRIFAGIDIIASTDDVWNVSFIFFCACCPFDTVISTMLLYYSQCFILMWIPAISSNSKITIDIILCFLFAATAAVNIFLGSHQLRGAAKCDP